MLQAKKDIKRKVVYYRIQSAAISFMVYTSASFSIRLVQYVYIVFPFYVMKWLQKIFLLLNNKIKGQTI